MSSNITDIRQCHWMIMIYDNDICYTDIRLMPSDMCLLLNINKRKKLCKQASAVILTFKNFTNYLVFLVI